MRRGAAKEKKKISSGTFYYDGVGGKCKIASLPRSCFVVLRCWEEEIVQ
jgi:hypothetical protein